jgi:hypothetical protein
MSVINCNLGLISKPKDHTQNCFLNLGEIFDRSIRQDVNILYELHKNLRYLCAFKAKIEGKDIIPDNIEEISTLQNRYKLTRKIWVKGQVQNGAMKFLSPELYDLSCMVPLFPNKISRSICPKGNEMPLRMFVLFPYTDPIVRGEIVNNCFSVLGKYKACFYTIGGLQGHNTRATCDLSRRYLLTCGVEDDNISCIQYDEFPDCILEVLNMIKFILPETEMQVFIAVQREDMNRVMDYIRLANKLGIIDRKLCMICN